MADFTGQAIKGYELRETLGAGGFGAVYRAFQPVVGRDVAIKVILPKFANQPDFIRRFEAEAQLVARLEHPHIVPLYDYWRDPAGAYLVMRLLRGGSLRTALESGAWRTDATARLLDQIASALAAAHRAGIVHRDLKPDNILLDEDRNAYLADFGIAKVLGRDEDAAQAGQIVGSLAYLSPEQITGDPVTLRSDLYSLGIVLYETLTGEPPFKGVSTTALISKHLNEPLPALPVQALGLPEAVDAVIQKATSKVPTDRYEDAPSLAIAFREALGESGARLRVRSRPVDFAGTRTTMPAALPESPDGPTIITDTLLENPYKGLRAFQEGDAQDFFGREALTERLLERMASSDPEARFLAVVGPSGSGKSSAVRAGLIPALRDGALNNSEHWFYVEMIPGTAPFRELETALLRVAVRPVDNLLGLLESDDAGLLQAVNSILPADDPTVEVCLLIDQFEEIFTLLDDNAARARFLNNLLSASTDPASRLRVLVTLRADFYDKPLLYPDFGELLRKRTEVVLPLNAAELEQAIVGPVHRVGVRLESGLVEAIIQDVGEQPGALPLLQYALTELFERRVGNVLTLSAYRDSGGVFGALARRADQLYEELNESGQRIARQIFLRLVTLGEGTEDTRRRVRRAELSSVAGSERAMDTVLDTYGRYRLLTFDRDPVTRGPTVEVAHEALIRTWKRLRVWLDANREDLRTQRRLSEAAQEWVNNSRESSFLASGARLEGFIGFAEDTELALNQEEKEFLQASIAERDAQRAADLAQQQRELALQRRAANRLRALVAFLLVATVGALALSGFAVSQQQLAANNAATATNEQGRADNNASTAVANANVAATAQNEAVQNAATAQFNATRSESLRLAAEGSRLLQGGGSAETAALLSIRSLRLFYSPQADAALTQAIGLAYTRRLLSGHADDVTGVAISPDGKLILTTSLDRGARLWDATTGEEVRRLEGINASVLSAAFSPDGRYVLTGSADRTVRLWDVANGTLLRTFTASALLEMRQIGFSIDGTVVFGVGVTQSTGGLFGPRNQVYLWNAETGAEIVKLDAESAALAPDGASVLAGGFDNNTALLYRGNGNLTLSGHTGVVNAVALSPDGTLALTGSADDSARLWNAEDGSLRLILSGHTADVLAVAFSPDGKYALTASADRTVRIWDVASGALVRRLVAHLESVSAAVWSADGQTIVTGSQDNTARIWDARIGVEPRQFGPHVYPVINVAVSPDSRYVATAGGNAVQLWDAATFTELRRLEGHEAVFPDNPNVWGLAFSPDGKTLATGGTDSTIRLWDVETGDQIAQLNGHASLVAALAFSPDGRYLASTSLDDTGRLWDVAARTTLRVFEGHTAAIFGVAYSADGRYIATASDDGTARLWDAYTGELVHQLEGHTGEVNNVAFSPDSRFVATASRDQSARLWNVASGLEVRQFLGHGANVRSLAFSPDSALLVTVGGDALARVWDVASGAEVRQLAGHSERALSVAYAPNGKYLVTGSADRNVRLWDTDYRDLIVYSCGRLIRDLTDAERQQYLIETGEGAATCPQFGTMSTPLPPTLTPLPTVVLPAFTPFPTATLQPSPTPLNIAGLDDHAILPFAGHTADVLSIDVSPDGRFLATGGKDNTARLWDARTGQELRRFEFGGEVRTVAFSPDGTLLLTARLDPNAPDQLSLRLWDVATGQSRGAFANLEESAGEAAFSPDGKLIYSLSFIGTQVNVWDIAAGRRTASYSVSIPSPIELEVSPDGKYLLAISLENAAAILLDAATGRRVRQFQVSGLNEAVFSADSRFVISGGTAPRLWDVETGQRLLTFNAPDHFGPAVLSPDGKLAATTLFSGAVLLWDAATGESLGGFEGVGKPITALRFSPDGRYLFAGELDGAARRLDVTRRGDMTALLATPTPRPTITPTPASAAQAQAATLLYTLRASDQSGEVMSVAFSPDGRYVLTGGEDRIARLWDAATGKEVRRFAGHLDVVRVVAFSPDGKQILTGASGEDGFVRLWDIESGREVRRFAAREDFGQLSTAAISPDGRYVFSAVIDIRMWDATTGELVRNFDTGTVTARMIAISPDGRYLAAGGPGNKSAMLFDVATGREVRDFAPENTLVDFVFSVAFSPDGKSLLVANSSSVLRLWDVETGVLQREYTVPGGGLGLDFLPDGKSFVAGGTQNDASQVDVATGAVLARLEGHSGSVEWLDVSPDGRQVVTAGADGTARLWRLP